MGPRLDGIVGATVMLAEDDYMYGVGVLRLVVERATPLRSEPGWALLDGVWIDHRGVRRDRREILARIAGLKVLDPPAG